VLVDIARRRSHPERLKARVAIAVDDFGTAYSSLSYLSQLPIDALRSTLLRQSGHERGHDAAIAQAVIPGTSSGMRVVAEGIETVEQLGFLRTHECDEGRGISFRVPCIPMRSHGLSLYRHGRNSPRFRQYPKVV